MKLAVCLLTCGRHDLTRRCVDSFAAINYIADPRLVLLQADEPSMGPQSAQIGAGAGFRLVHGPTQREGQMAALRALVAAAIGADCEHILWLENDWATLEPLPWPQIGAAETVRLFGAFKRPAPEPIEAGRKLLVNGSPLVFKPAGPGWERGPAHWAGGASIIRTAILANYANVPTLKDVIKASEPLDTLRPLGNIMASMGAARTEGRLN